MRKKPRIGITVNCSQGRRLLWLPLAYSRRLEEAGAIPLLLPPMEPPAAQDLAGSLDGLLLSGGGDLSPLYYGEEPRPGLGEVDPRRDAWEFALVRAALLRRLPLLGICRGLQVMNAALGGSLVQDLGGTGSLQHRQKAPRSQPSHSVEILPRTRLSRILGEGSIAVNSFHHQAAARIAPELRKAAVAPDGVIEALECIDDRFLAAVQWHPESLHHPASELLFSAFVGAAAESV